ncbi:MAG: competence protein ComEC, partial [Candidatus Endobugula sp.]
NILLTGDIEKEAEYGLLGIADLPENIDIMLVPHHGSKTSSSDSLLAHLRPSFAIATAGYNNQYRHPHPTIVERYDDVNTIFINTAVSGAVRLTIQKQGDDWRLEKWRQLKKRYWYDEDD